MTDLDRILSSKGDIVPSSGFASSVMDAVRRTASEPPPISFPWVRALPLGAAWLAAPALIVAAAKQAPTIIGSAPTLTNAMHPIRRVLETLQPYSGVWVILALLVTAVSLLVSLRLVRVRT